MEEQLNNEPALHPELAFQAGIPQEKKLHDIHPSLRAELDPQEEMVEKQTEPEEEVVEKQTSDVDNSSTTEDKVSTVQETSPAKDRHWRALREEADRAKALERELEYYKNQQTKQASTNDDEDEYSTKKDWRQIERRQVELEEKLRKAEQQNAVARAERQLLEDYPDIREVVSDENIQKLQDEFPHLYKSVIASNDVYTVGAAAHEMIVAKGLYKPKSNALNQVANINRNQSKPRSASQVSANSGTTPLARANSYAGNSISSEEERKALWAEMNQYAKNRI